MSELFCLLVNRDSKLLGEILRDRCVSRGRGELKDRVVLLEAVSNKFDYDTRCWAKPIKKDSRTGVHMCDPADEPNMFYGVSVASSEALTDTIKKAIRFFLDCMYHVLTQQNAWEDGYVPIEGNSEIRVVLNVMDLAYPDDRFVLCLKEEYYVTPLPGAPVN